MVRQARAVARRVLRALKEIESGIWLRERDLNQVLLSRSDTTVPKAEPNYNVKITVPNNYKRNPGVFQRPRRLEVGARPLFQ